VFEEAPAPPPIDTALNKLHPLEEALQSLGESDATGSTSSESVIAPPPPRERDETPDETMERAPVARPRDLSGWTVSAIAAPPLPTGHDDWVVTNVAHAVRSIELDDVEAELLIEEGTPIEGVVAVAPPLPLVEMSFVAGEIDVPTPPPMPDRDHDTPAVEFTAASPILGSPEADPDTGSRTPPIERR
jgi:hypothetical protein